MSTEESNVVMNFKTDGAVEMASTVKELNTIMNTAAKQYRAQMAAMGENATKTDELAARQQKLAVQFEAAQKRTTMLTSEFDKMKASGTATGSEMAKMAGKVLDAQRNEANLGSALSKANTELSSNGKAALAAKEKLASLATEGSTLQAKQAELSSSIKLENASMGSNATAAQKMETSQKQLAAQTTLAKQVVANLENQLKQTKNAYGENSTEAVQMATKLNQAKTSVAELDTKLGALGNQSNQTSNRLGTFREKLSFGAVAGAASNAVSAVTGGLTGLVQSAAQSSDSIDKFKSTMKGADFGSTEINKASKTMKTYADQTVYDTQTVMNTTAQLAANGISNYTELTQAAGNMNAQFGGTADTFHSVAMVMTQTAGAGKLTTENWNQLADAIPGASGKLQEAMKNNGAYTGNFRDAMEKGQISSKEFNDAVTQLGMNKGAVEAAKSTSTFEGAIGSLQANVTNGMQKVLESIGKEKLTEIINLIGNGISGALQVLANGLKLVADHQDTFKVLGAAAVTMFAAFKGVSAITKVVTVFKSLKTAFTAVKGAMTLMNFAGIIGGLGPMLPVILGIGVAITAIIVIFKNWNKIVAVTKTAWKGLTTFFKGLWDGIKQIFTNTLKAIGTFLKSNIGQTLLYITNPIAGTILLIKNHWNEIKQATTTVFNAIKQLLSTVWNGIKTAISSAVNAIKAVVSTVWNGIKSVTSTVFGVIGNVASSIWNGIKSTVSSVANAIGGAVSSAWNAIKNTTSNVFNRVRDVASNVWNGIKSTVSNVVNGVKSVVSSAWNGIKSITSSAFNGVKSTVSSIMNGIHSTVSGIVGKIKSVFNGMSLHFPSISIPHIPLPHLSISGGFSIKPPRVPSFGINWYAKGGIFTKPTLLGTNGGANGVGDAGPEAALPLTPEVLGNIGKGIASTMVSSQPIILQIDGRTFAQMAGPYMSDYLNLKDSTSNFSYGRRAF